MIKTQEILNHPLINQVNSDKLHDCVCNCLPFTADETVIHITSCLFFLFLYELKSLDVVFYTLDFISKFWNEKWMLLQMIWRQRS